MTLNSVPWENTGQGIEIPLLAIACVNWNTGLEHRTGHRTADIALTT